MRVTTVYIRFFRSFNFDYERKAIEGADRHPWEMIDDVWYPFVRVPIEPNVTAVVGANESGKTHLIDAVTTALTGEGIDRGDFCRYSSLFEVESGRRRNPDFGVELELQAEEDVKAVGVDGIGTGDKVTFLRLGDGRNLLITRNSEENRLPKPAVNKLQARFPVPTRLKTNVPLPDSISFDAILDRSNRLLDDRKGRFQIIELFRRLGGTDDETVSKNSGEISEILNKGKAKDALTVERDQESADLAKSLLLEVGNIDKSAFEDLERELRNGSEGKVGGIISKMNRALARHLNFNRWWRQDRDFKLQLEPRERELVFTITDRTGTNYAFAERSRGLSYFLSYFVQLQAQRQSHKSQDGQSAQEILLMDEPDAYLSSMGQQDLLRALEDFASPESAQVQNQVIYVTHSPFLINRNAAHRIRVLDKGTDQEGTRVVKDVSRNHYEPLRSSIGAYVAETAFVSGSNLLVEGLADQILLTSLTSLLRSEGVGRSNLLDLNETTIVPAGSASGVAYMAYLVRGRDEIKPACVALLDGDVDGKKAVDLIAGKGLKRREVIKSRYVVRLDEWGQEADLDLPDGVSVIELEDLIPIDVAVEAGRAYAAAILRCSPDEAAVLKEDSLRSQLQANSDHGIWDALEAAYGDVFEGARIEKAGFAKEVAAVVDSSKRSGEKPAGFEVLESNFSKLIAKLNELLTASETEEMARRTNRRSDRIVSAFLSDYQEPVSRDHASELLREIQSSLENTHGDEAVRAELARMQGRFELTIDPLKPVSEFDAFRERLQALPSIRREAYRPPRLASAQEQAATAD